MVLLNFFAYCLRLSGNYGRSISVNINGMAFYIFVFFLFCHIQCNRVQISAIYRTGLAPIGMFLLTGSKNESECENDKNVSHRYFGFGIVKQK